MAKYETRLFGSFDAVLGALHDGIMNASSTASFEDASFCRMGGTRVAVRVYERYSAMGSNRVSMTVTLVGEGEELFLSAITSGGSQAMFFKVNTFGERTFLDTLINAAEKLK
ncbi:MAG: hypothetical protein E7330_04940 [Clostridiales bacterium]|nr:hypothetical protein [Clostridiales bacterium]